jgi:hypothetical protein
MLKKALVRFLVAVAIAIATFLDRRFRWYRLRPEWLSLGVLLLLRTRLRRENLHHISLGMPSNSTPTTPACRRWGPPALPSLAMPRPKR